MAQDLARFRFGLVLEKVANISVSWLNISISAIYLALHEVLQ